ncbi:hypothetical protein LB520_16680 [Mesorhizobium sp. CA12]|nr:hypothetical protein [Mesorhizobium sp. CA12]
MQAFVQCSGIIGRRERYSASAAAKMPGMILSGIAWGKGGGSGLLENSLTVCIRSVSVVSRRCPGYLLEQQEVLSGRWAAPAGMEP